MRPISFDMDQWYDDIQAHGIQIDQWCQSSAPVTFSGSFKMPNLPNTMDQSANDTLPPILRAAITMVASIWPKDACKYRYKKQKPSCPSNDILLFLCASLQLMIKNILE